jgi:hypothetical protein
MSGGVFYDCHLFLAGKHRFHYLTTPCQKAQV